MKLLSAYFQPAFNRAFAGLCGLWGRFLAPAKPVLNAPKAGSGGLSPGPKATLKTTVRGFSGAFWPPTVVLGVEFWSGFGPVSAMKTGLFGPGNRTKSPVSAVKSGLSGPGNRTKSPVFQCDFGEKAENKPTIEKRNRAFREEKSSFSRRFQDDISLHRGFWRA